MSARRWTLIAAILGLSIAILDSTVVYIALPRMERDFEFGLSGQQWVVSAYLVPLAALILVGGALGDRYGRRRVFLAGLLIFSVASAAAGLAPTASVLFASRALQGLGGALLMPATLALVTATFTGEERGAAIGAWAGWSGVAAAIGPLVAGVAIQLVSWRLIFFLSPPVAGAAALIAWRFVSESRDAETRGRPLDYPGALLAVAALGGVATALVQGPRAGWDAPAFWLAGIAGLVALAAFAVRQRRASYPMLPPSVFRNRNFTAGNLSTIPVYGSFNGSFFLLGIYLQSVLGYSPFEAGAATLPLTLVMMALSPWSGRLAERIGARRPMSVGPLVMALGLLWLAWVEPGDAYWTAVLPGILVFALGLATTVAPLTTAVMESVEEREVGLGAGVSNTAARMAGMLGVALLGLVFALAFRAGTPESADLDGGDPAASRAVSIARERPTSALDSIPAGTPDETVSKLQTASANAFRVALMAGAAIALLGGVIAFAGVRTRPPAAVPRDRVATVPREGP